MLHVHNIGPLVAHQQDEALRRAAAYRTQRLVDATRRGTPADRPANRSSASTKRVWRTTLRRGIVGRWMLAVRRSLMAVARPSGRVSKEA